MSLLTLQPPPLIRVIRPDKQKPASTAQELLVCSRMEGKSTELNAEEIPPIGDLAEAGCTYPSWDSVLVLGSQNDQPQTSLSPLFSKKKKRKKNKRWLSWGSRPAIGGISYGGLVLLTPTMYRLHRENSVDVLSIGSPATFLDKTKAQTLSQFQPPKSRETGCAADDSRK